MTQVFLQRIHVNECRNLKDFDVPISEDTRKHLILTGKNGSGKTSLLNEVDHMFREVVEDRSLELFFSDANELRRMQFEGTFLSASFESKRTSKLQVPSGIMNVEIPKQAAIEGRVNTQFLQYLVNLKADRSFARDDGKHDDADRIDAWFTQFTGQLRIIFDAPDLTLDFDRHAYTFNILIPGMKPFGFNALSDGYSAILSIVTELLLRMEAHGTQRKAYDMEGLVLIDEIETHLHVDLQKKILPFLISNFSITGWYEMALTNTQLC